MLAAAAYGIGAAQAAYASDGYYDNYDFTGLADGNSPRGDLLYDGIAGFYGTSSAGGDAGDGTVYYYLPPDFFGEGQGTLTRIWSFSGTDGSLPTAGLVADASGALYGTASRDGPQGGGTVFQLSPPARGQTAWTETTLLAFGPGPGAGGNTPVGTLIFDQAGNLYGTTSFGGSFGQGVVFELSPPGERQGSWTETVLWNFTGGVDGGQPAAGLVMDMSGNLFGTAKTGGSAGVGTIFELSPPALGTQWSQATLYSFQGGADGASPQSTLVFDTSGALYGTTVYGGDGDPGERCVQVHFPYYGIPDARSDYARNAPYIPLGGNSCGVVFQLSPPAKGSQTWTETAIYQFTGGDDGSAPIGAVTFDQSGNLYSLNTMFGQLFWGAITKLAPPQNQGGTWTETDLGSLIGKLEGFYPHAGFAVGPGGYLYATMPVGGKTWQHVSVYGYGAIITAKP